MEPIREKSTADYILKFIPLTSGVLIYLGLLKSAVYYSFFNINILEYISLSETIIFAIDFFIIILVMGGFGYLFAQEVVQTEKIINQLKKDGNITVEKVRQSIQNANQNNFRKVYLAIVIFWVLSIVVTLFTNDKMKWYYILITSILFGTIILGNEYSRPRKNDRRNIDTKTRSLIVLFITFSILIGLDSIQRAEKIKVRSSEYRTFIILKQNLSVVTSDTLLFVGKTERYTFLYNKLEDAPEIISNDEIIITKQFKR